jgi:flagellar basal-body rod protein FlgG
LSDSEFGKALALAGAEYCMIKGIFNTAASMIPRVKQQEIIANNLANAETVGYKRDSLFLRMVKTQMGLKQRLAPSWETRMIDKLYTDYSAGALDATGRELDLALQGDGFFAVLTPNGEAYTRNGAFSVGPDGTLVNSDNYPVLTDGGPIVLRDEKITVAMDGQISAGTQVIGKLRIVDFVEPDSVRKASGSLFTLNPGAIPIAPTQINVRQGYLEKANVDVMREMANMIESYRQFETGQKMIQIQDDSLGKAVSELPRV